MEGRSGKRVGVARWRARENAASVSQREREKEDKQDTQSVLVAKLVYDH